MLDLLHVRIHLVDALIIALQQLYAGKLAGVQLSLDFIDAGLLQLEIITPAHGEEIRAIDALLGEIKGIRLIVDLRGDQTVVTVGGGRGQGDHGQGGHGQTSRCRSEHHGKKIDRGLESLLPGIGRLEEGSRKAGR